jgi:hypothetical protein
LLVGFSLVMPVTAGLQFVGVLAESAAFDSERWVQSWMRLKVEHPGAADASWPIDYLELRASRGEDPPPLPLNR